MNLSAASRPDGPPPVVVIGLCKHGLYLTRNFTRHGVPVLVIERDFSQHSARTRYGRKIHCADLVGPALIDKLIELKTSLPAPVALFPTNDRMIDLLAAHHDQLSDHYRVPFPRGDLVVRLKDKTTLHAMASDEGLNVPASYRLDGVRALDQVADALSFPVAVKPVLPMSSFKSAKCDDLASLRERVASSEAIGEPLIVQDWIEGGDRDILFGAYYIGRDGRCHASYSGHKLLCYPPLTGHAAATEGVAPGPWVEAGARFLSDVGFRGLCSSEYKGTNRQSPRFVEVTVGRCDWWIMACEINGVNLPMAAYNDMVDAQVPFENRQQDRCVWHDIEHAWPVLIDNLRHRRWRLRDVVAYLWLPKRDALFDWRDPMPFVAFAASLPARIARMCGRRWRRAVA